MIVEVNYPTFFVKKDNPSEVVYDPSNLKDYEPIIVEFFDPLPVPKEDEVFYKYSINRGALINLKHFIN